MKAVTSLALDFIRAKDAGERYAFRTGQQEYVLRSEGGGAESVKLDWSSALLEDLIALHNPGCDPAVVQRVGRALRGFLKSDSWARQEARLTEAVSRGQPVVVTLRSAAAELYALPWELLTLDATGQHLGELPSVLVRYEWPQTVTVAESPSPRPEGGRVLFACPSAGDPVPKSEHLCAIEEGARAGHFSFDARRDVLERATYGRLEDALKAAQAPGGAPISVLHLLCHGSAAGQTCGLLLDGEYEGESAILDAGRLRGLLAPYAGMVRLVVVAACNGGNMGAMGNQLGSVALALHSAGVAAVIASRFPFSVAGSNRFSETFYRELLGGPSSVETAFLAARRQLARDTTRLDWASLQLYIRGADGEDSRPIVLRPYRGLLAFQPEHSRFFFGREAEVTEILGDLEALTKKGAPRFLVVAGASGTGKSSVVLAGAVPRLLRTPGARWVFARMRPGPEPLAALEAALATRTDDSRPLLLVVDQLEELFTQTESAEARSAFARRLWALAGEASSGVSVLITIRVDFIGHCGDILLDDKGQRLDKVAYDEAHRVFVAQMTPAQIEEAITRPAGLVGLRLEAGLTQRMLEDVEGEPGALPLLQDTLDILWQRREGPRLTQAAYDAVGGIAGALNSRADAQLAALDEVGQKVARRLLVRLVSARTDTAMDTRRRATLEELRPRGPEDQARFEQILGRLVDERLLVRTNNGTATTVEVAHEALIRKWPRLRKWVDEDRVKLAELEQVASWVEEWRKHGALLNAEQLAFAQTVSRNSAEELGDDARKLLAKSLAEARRRRWAQWLALAGTAAAAVVFAVLGSCAQQQTREARKQALQARDASRVSVARQLAAVPHTAISVLREVEVQDPGQALGWLGAVPHLSSQAFETRAVLKHEEAITLAVFSPDGTRVVTASEDNTARVWKADGTLLARLEGHTEPIYSAAISTDGTRVVTASEDTTARVWKADGSSFVALEGHTGPVHFAAINADGTRVVTISVDNSAREWKHDGFKGPDAYVTSATFSLNGASIITVAEDNTRQVRNLSFSLFGELSGWDAASAAFSLDGTRILMARDDTAWLWKTNGSSFVELRGHTEQISSATFSPDGLRVVTASQDKTARVWRADGSQIARLEGHVQAVRFAAFSPDGLRVVTASLEDDTARVWRADGPLLSELMGHEGSVVSAAFSPDSKSVVTVSWDNTARVWDVDATLLAEFKGHGDSITSAAFSSDGTRVVTASEGETARVWKADGSSFIGLEGHVGLVTSAAFSPDGKHVVTASADGTARVWRADGSSPIELKGHAGPVTSAAFSPDGEHVVTASADGTARVWKADGSSFIELEGHEGNVTSAAFSPDGKHVVTASDDRTARVWKADGTPRATLDRHDGRVFSAAFSPDGTRVLTAFEDITAQVWKADGTFLNKLEGHELKVVFAAFSPDGTHVVTASWDRTARVWKADGTWSIELTGHKGHVTSAAFSPDGTRVVTASKDNTARVWKTDGTLLAELKGHAGPVTSAAFSPNGMYVITGSADATARTWLIDPHAIRRQFWLSTSPCLSPAQRSLLLGEPQLTAERGHTACQEMTNCVRRAAYEGCIKQFHEAQAELYSRTPPTSVDVSNQE